jgi:predicted Zn-dependent protease
MWPLRHEIVSIGGSHAQRDLFAQIMCDAAVHSSRRALARSLLSERVRSRPTKKRNWQTYAQMLAALGESERAAEARKRGEAAVEAGA